MEDSPLYRDWLNLSLQLLWCYEARFESGDTLQPHWQHNGAWLVMEGWAEAVRQGRSCRAGPGEWMFLHEGVRGQRFSRPVRLLSIAYEARWPDGTPHLDAGLPITVEASLHPGLEVAAREILHRMENALPHTRDPREQPILHRDFLPLQALLPLWLKEALDVLAACGVEPVTRSGLDPRVTEALHQLNTLPLGTPLDGPALARTLGLSKVHLDRLFRQQLGTSLSGYQTRLRLEYACRCLRASDENIKRISFTLGFRHPAHFTRWFRKKTGTPPRQYADHPA